MSKIIIKNRHKNETTRYKSNKTCTNLCVDNNYNDGQRKKSFQDYKATAKQTNKINKTPIVLILAYRFSTILVKYH